MMRQIYERASLVLVWLGKAEDDVNNQLAFRKMKEFVEKYQVAMKENHPHKLWLPSHNQHTADQDLFGFLTLNTTTDTTVWDCEGSDTHKAWLGICALWKSPWWTRTWIFQEATIPERAYEVWLAGIKILPTDSKVKFLCGGETASWRDITVTQSVCVHLQAIPALKSATGFMKNLEQPVTNLLKFRGIRLRKLSPSFMDFLYEFRGTQCSDLRDKVYAPLCLAPESTALEIAPDYDRKGVRDVYIDVVSYSLAQSGHELDFLGYTMFTSHGPPKIKTSQLAQTFLDFFRLNQTPRAVGPDGLEFPSWLPDWSKELALAPIPKTLYVPSQPQSTLHKTYDLFRGVALNNEIQVPSFEATKGASCTARIDGLNLHLQAIYIDIIDDIIPYTGTDMEAVKKVAYEKGLEWGHAAEGGKYEATEESLDEAMKHTNVLDLKYDWRGRPCARGGRNNAALVQQPRQGMGKEDLELKSQAVSAWTTATRGRFIGKTEQGFIGMVPNGTQAGDQVFAILGGKVLYTLRLERKVEREYTYIGETYIHGCMDGEVMEWIEDFAEVVDIVLV